MNKTKVIDVKNLSKSFDGKKAVDNVALEVFEGEIFGFLGPNGSGKTTTLRMLCGLLIPDAGSGTCLGYDILKKSLQIKLHVGYMTQHFSLYKDLTIEENLEFVARLYAVKNRKEAVEKSLVDLGLIDRRKQLTGTLSGGYKQRLALSAALLHKPKLLLLDEPTAGVDPKARRDFWNEIHRLSTEGITTLVTTHYMDEAERCHRLAYISQGAILTRGTEEEVIKESGLSTFVISGPNVAEIALKLQKRQDGVQTALFGNVLHISGQDRDQLQHILEQLKHEKFFSEYSCEEATPSLEDVFIGLVDSGGRSKK